MTDTFDAFIDSLIETDVADMAVAKNKPDNRVKFPCGQCAGTGRYQGARVHQEKSHCFACRGKGYFLSSPEKRQQSRDAARQRARGTVEKGVAAMSEAHPALYADLLDAYRTNEGGSEFIHSLASQLFTKGRLSDKQIDAWYRGKARLAERQAEWAAQAKEREVEVDLSPIKAMFDRAKANGLKRTAYRAEGVTLKGAPDTGRNAGALYVTLDESGAYMGKLVGGVFHPLREAPSSVGDALRAIAADPKEAAVRWGQKTGRCSCCGRELTDPASISLGIGPICAEKWGL